MQQQMIAFFVEYDSLVGNYRTLISTNPGYAPLIKGELFYESRKLNEALPESLAAIDEAVTEVIFIF